jgi:hypothetical protein
MITLPLVPFMATTFPSPPADKRFVTFTGDDKSGGAEAI